VTTKHQLNIDLPPGLQTGSIIRLTGIRAAGEACAEGLFLRIRVQPYW
jgi:hypothetical protein